MLKKINMIWYKKMGLWIIIIQTKYLCPKHLMEEEAAILLSNSCADAVTRLDILKEPVYM